MDDARGGIRLRRPLILIVAVLMVAGLVGAQMALANHGNTIRAEGREEFEANALFASTFRFEPDILHVGRGESVRLVDSDEADAPHTLTIVRRNELPTDFRGAFVGCEVCRRTIDRHLGSGPPDPVLEDDRDREYGLDGPGDSILIFPGESISRRVSAAPGTTLHFLCAFHPWMMGKISVR